MTRRFAAAAIAILLEGCARQGAPPPVVAEASDAQRLVALVDYVGSDYAMAVKDGVVASPAEYEEQIRFVRDARNMAGNLLKGATTSDPLVPALDRLVALVESKAPATEVATACRTAKEEAVARFGLRTTPAERPSLERAQALYTESCQTCHGATGNGDTERARQLDPQPVSFKDPGRRAVLSPYRVFNTLTFGVPGTAMASFDSLTPSDRWSLAFFVFRLGHAEGAPATEAEHAAVPLADMAIRSDAEMLEILRREGHPAPQQGLHYVRTEGAFQEPPAGVGIDRTRLQLRQALAAFEAGRPRDADRLVLDAYLQGFEPLEPRLRARDEKGTLEVERAFHVLRSAILAEDQATVRSAHRMLDQRLEDTGGGRTAAVPFVAAFVIYFREGFEAALLVGALLAGLRKLGRADARRYIHIGWVAAIPAGVVTWWLANRFLSVSVRQQEVLEAVISLLAAAVLFSMSFWMISKIEAQRWMAYLRRRLEKTLTGKNVATLAFVSFLAVYREAAETVLFTQALLLDTPAAARQIWMGAAAGLFGAAVLAVIMNRTVVRLPISTFFGVSSALLCVLAISFAGAGFYELVSAGYLPPRPVSFPEVPWLGVHGDLTPLAAQGLILLVLAAAGVVSYRQRGRMPQPE